MKYLISTLFLCLIINILGCAIEFGNKADYRRVIKDKETFYCKPAYYTWRGRWWDYYQRGISCADGGFWDQAIADFKAAILQRSQDGYRVRTYGLRFENEYFPHRELGIIYYRLARQNHGTDCKALESSHRAAAAVADYTKAEVALKRSWDSVNTSKAELFLDKVRKCLAHIQRSTIPQNISVHLAPPAKPWTNRKHFEIQGEAKGGAYVKVLSITHKGREGSTEDKVKYERIPLVKRNLSFAQEFELRDGPNDFEIVAEDVLGNVSEPSRLTIYLDRQGPFISFQSLHYEPADQQWLAQGLITDVNPITAIELNGTPMELKDVKIQNGFYTWPFPKSFHMNQHQKALTFMAKDIVGNTTRGELPSNTVVSLAQKTRHRPLKPSHLTRWAAVTDQTVMTDMASDLGSTPHLTVNAQYASTTQNRAYTNLPITFSLKVEEEDDCSAEIQSFQAKHNDTKTVQNRNVLLRIEYHIQDSRGGKNIRINRGFVYISHKDLKTSEKLDHISRDSPFGKLSKIITLREGKNEITIDLKQNSRTIYEHKIDLIYRDQSSSYKMDVFLASKPSKLSITPVSENTIIDPRHFSENLLKA